VVALCGLGGALIFVGSLAYSVHRETVARESATPEARTKLLIDEGLKPMNAKIDHLTEQANWALRELSRIHDQVRTLKPIDPHLLAKRKTRQVARHEGTGE
jgi:hypothetical protein